ncbi:formate dehydrogenase subunit delta [Kribbella sp. NBC_00482]|uniref:formate dehydrogenase subunit delta n=1 Tax=Kribbella sp. NBC_00482 TaxID=2975968 RepID=UPI002E17EF7D
MSGGVPPHVRLANEIAAQFAHRPPADAATAIANHMNAVWDPRMKQALIAHVASGATDLDPAAALAAQQLQAPA